jgi:hypothetical protein
MATMMVCRVSSSGARTPLLIERFTAEFSGKIGL